MTESEEIYQEVIQPFLKWVHEYQIQTFVDVVGDIGFVCLIPIIFVCGIKYLCSGKD